MAVISSTHLRVKRPSSSRRSYRRTTRHQTLLKTTENMEKVDVKSRDERLSCASASSSEGFVENRPTAKEWIAAWRSKSDQASGAMNGDGVKKLILSLGKTTIGVSALIVMDKAVFASLASCLKMTWLPSPLLGMFVIFGGLYAGQVRECNIQHHTRAQKPHLYICDISDRTSEHASRTRMQRIVTPSTHFLFSYICRYIVACVHFFNSNHQGRAIHIIAKGEWRYSSGSSLLSRSSRLDEYSLVRCVQCVILHRCRILSAV